MKTQIEGLVAQYESRVLTRRQLVGALAVMMATSARPAKAGQ